MSILGPCSIHELPKFYKWKSIYKGGSCQTSPPHESTRKEKKSSLLPPTWELSLFFFASFLPFFFLQVNSISFLLSLLLFLFYHFILSSFYQRRKKKPLAFLPLAFFYPPFYRKLFMAFLFYLPSRGRPPNPADKSTNPANKSRT